MTGKENSPGAIIDGGTNDDSEDEANNGQDDGADDGTILEQSKAEFIAEDEANDVGDCTKYDVEDGNSNNSITNPYTTKHEDAEALVNVMDVSAATPVKTIDRPPIVASHQLQKSHNSSLPAPSSLTHQVEVEDVILEKPTRGAFKSLYLNVVDPRPAPSTSQQAATGTVREKAAVAKPSYNSMAVEMKEQARPPV